MKEGLPVAGLRFADWNDERGPGAVLTRQPLLDNGKRMVRWAAA